MATKKDIAPERIISLKHKRRAKKKLRKQRQEQQQQERDHSNDTVRNRC